MSPLLLISQLATSEPGVAPLCRPAGWDSTNSCLAGVLRSRCAKLAGAFGHVDDLIHTRALSRNRGYWNDHRQYEGSEMSCWKGCPLSLPPPVHFPLLVGSAIEVMLFSARRRHDFMISTLFAENSLSFPFEPWHLAWGHLILRKPKPFCRHPIVVPH